MDGTLNKVILGALLHDIGKVIQKAADNPKKMRHSKFGADFLHDCSPELYNAVGSSILFHHQKEISEQGTVLKDNDFAYIVYEADNIAAGLDRRENTEETSKSYDKTMLLGR